IVILSTHIVSDVEYIADEILVMRAGSFIMQGAPTDIVATVTGKVWECHVDARRADELAAASCVSNVHYAADGHAVARVVADEAPVAGARALDPTLEDVYLYVFRDEVVPLS
ncbi:MAG: ABC transporter ATP-binding protein, partial [Eggerthella lenta]